jgi:hypothetical protein
LASDNIIALVVSQDLADSENVQGLCSERCPASSRDVYQAISMKTAVFADAGEEEYPVPITFPGIYAEPEVSCVSVRWISQILVSSFYELSLSEQITFIKVPFPPNAEKCKYSMWQLGRSRHNLSVYPTIPVCTHVLF